jgi:RHS repeat-associated protein
MRALSAVLLAAFAAPVFGQYSYYFTDPMSSLQTSYWSSTGSPQFTNIYGYWGAANGSSSTNSSMVSTVVVPDGTSSYGVRATVHFPNGVGGAGFPVSLLLRASSTFSSNGLPTTAYVVQFSCASSASSISVSKIISGTVTAISSGASGFSCSDGMTIRASITDNGQIISFINDAFAGWAQDTSITSGAPGIVLPQDLGTNDVLVSTLQLGPADRIAPGPIPTNALTYSVYPTHIDFQWQAISDDPNGTGVCLYQFLRNDNFAQNTTTLSWSDTTVQPGTEYTYTFIVYDRFFNFASQTITITVPPISGGAPTPPDGRRVGVRPTGAYWGASTEQIDVLSGNVNYSIPLLKAMARSGWGVGFGLAYNSQNWRQDSGGIWNLGEDVGYGYGWKLLAGSLTPIWADQYTLYYYSYVDSTGAEYRLNQNNSGIWTSTDSIYVTFNSNTNTLYFRDGSFWVLGCTSATTEPDSGTMYPTTIEDTNGNQIIVAYQPGAGLSGSNSSARISTIHDVRAIGSYTFTYNSGTPNHLISITNNVGTGEAYTFTYNSLSLQAPFSPFTSYGSVGVLNQVAFTRTSQVYSFAYTSDQSGALQSSTLPNGGALIWSYQNVTYGNGATYREIAQRQLSKDGVNYTNYPFTYPAPGYSTNQYAVIDDPGGVGEKYWAFSQSGVNAGMVTQYQGRQLPGPVTKTQNDFTWAQDNVGNLYISSTLTTLDPGQSYQAQKKTDQSVDIHGNVLNVFQYDYNSLTTPARIYTYTYLNSSAYTTLYIYNRLTLATLGVGNQNVVTLAGNTYDSGYVYPAPTGVTNWDSSYASISARGNVTSWATATDYGSTTYDQTGNAVTASQDGVATQVTTTSATNYAAPSQLTVGSLTTSLDWSSALSLSGVTGPNGDNSAITYDSSGRPSTATSPFGAVTTYGYAPGPNNLSNPALSTAWTNSTRFITTILDGLGRTITVQTGNTTGVISQTDTVYGSCACSPTGKMIQQSLPHAPGATPAWTTYTYDGIGRTVSVVAPDSASTTSYVYQGNTVQVTDPAGKWKIFTMDAFGHLTQVNEPNPNAGTAPQQPVSPPAVSPAPGAYSGPLYVTLSTSTSGASIRYTINGTTPSETVGTLYSTPIPVTSSTTINAIAFAPGMADSAIVSAVYTIGSSGPGATWYNTAWGYRKAITIASSQVSGSSNLTNFPVLISVIDSNLALSAQSSGNDILFTASDGITKLNHEIETYVSSNGKLNAWVSVPSVSPTTNTVIYMYYGNSSASNQQSPTQAWDSNFIGVWHLPNGTTLGANDSTANANNGTISGAGAVTGEIGGGGSFNGTSNDISVGNGSSLQFTGPITMSAWVNVAAFQTPNTNNWAYIIGKGYDGTHEGYYLRLNAQNSSVIQLNAGSFGAANYSVLWPISGWSTNTWHQVVGTYDGTNWNVYLDGVLKASNTQAAGAVSSGLGVYLGAQDISPSGIQRFWNGDLDEVRLSNIARSPAWITTEYNNQSSPSTFFSVGSQQSQSGSGPSWYNTGWSYRKTITIASSQVSGSSSLTNFPELVSVTDSNLTTSAQSSGNDILFTASDGVTKLNHEIETYTSSTGQLTAWVQVPSLSPTANTVLYMYYGNPSASNQQNAAMTWDSNYGAVYHFPSSTTLTANDSTSNGNNGTINAASAVAGKIGGAASFNGSTSNITISNSSSEAIWTGGTFTVDGWFYLSATPNYTALFDTAARDLSLFLETGNTYFGVGGISTSTSLGSYSIGVWTHFAWTVSAGTGTFYINGSPLGSFSPGSSTTDHLYSLLLGSSPSGGNPLNGYEDEMRLSNIARSAAWIATEYNNQNVPSTYVSEGSQQSQGGGGGGGGYLTPVGMPTFSPAPGTYTSSQTVTISTTTSGASIRYTTNGTTPSETGGTLYSGSFTVASTTTIKAIAYKSGMADSEIPTVTYTISSSGGGGGNYFTYYTYDAWDNVNQVTMPRPSGTQTRTFTYSGKLLLSATNPENGTVTYTYNTYNKVATKTDAKGQAVVYTYDGIGRLTEVQRYPSGQSNAEDTCQRETYYWDSNPFNSSYSQYALGRLAAIQYYAPASGLGMSGCASSGYVSTFQEQYSYNVGGAKINKGVLLTRNLQSTTTSGPYTVDLESSYTYDNEGRMLTVQYPGTTGSSGPNLGYAYDAMGRLNTMTDVNASNTLISAATYDPANRLLTIAGSVYNETRSYNVMGQLTALSNNSVNIAYSYSATQNNGKITSQTDYISGEQVVYAYDALNRLASAGATSNAWGQSYTYDGFGNLTNQTVTAGTAPSLSVAYNNNNQQTTDGCVDANGNINSSSTGSFACASNPNVYGYDVSNRIVTVPGSTSYAYAPGNKRVWRGTTTSGHLSLDEITFWSVGGKKLATYTIQGGDPTVVYSPPSMTVVLATSNYYFGRKMIKNGTGYLGTDRLGSIGKFYPWGQEKPSATTNGTEKFTGYFRDAETQLDYAKNRYHQPGMGRFLSPDPYQASAGGAQSPGNPGSWNQYAYVKGDPVNYKDPTGLDWCDADDDSEDCFIASSGDPGYALYEQLSSAIAAAAAAVTAELPNSTPCFDTVQLYTRNTGNISGVGLLGASHSYVQITGPGQTIDAGTGTNVVTIEGFDNKGMLNGQAVAGNGLKNNHPSAATADGAPQIIPCYEANALESAANNFNPVPYQAAAGVTLPTTQGPLTIPGYNSNSFMHWFLNMANWVTFYANSSVERSIGWNQFPIPGN